KFERDLGHTHSLRPDVRTVVRKSDVTDGVETADLVVVTVRTLVNPFVLAVVRSAGVEDLAQRDEPADTGIRPVRRIRLDVRDVDRLLALRPDGPRLVVQVPDLVVV